MADRYYIYGGYPVRVTADGAEAFALCADGAERPHDPQKAEHEGRVVTKDQALRWWAEHPVTDNDRTPASDN